MKAPKRVWILSGVLCLSVLASCGGGHYYAGVSTGPPAPLVEGPYGVAPGPGYIWTPGYYDWGGGAYVWHRGAWQRPPHRNDHWVTPRWENHGDRYRQVPGGWQHGHRVHH